LLGKKSRIYSADLNDFFLWEYIKDFYVGDLKTRQPDLAVAIKETSAILNKICCKKMFANF